MKAGHNPPQGGKKGWKALKAKGLSVLIVSGFYGAGKTEVIKKILGDEKRHLRVAVIVNTMSDGMCRLIYGWPLTTRGIILLINLNKT